MGASPDVLAGLFRIRFGREPESAVPLCGSGSNRQYYRLAGGGSSVIGVIGSDLKENRSFIVLDRHFAACGLPVPRVLGVSDDGAAYIQDDMGDLHLADLVAQARKSGNYDGVKPLLIETVKWLPHFQFAENVDFSLCYPPAFDRRTVFFDLNYFKYCFLKPSGLEFDELVLQDDFEKLASDLLACEDCGATFLYRDFQARNVMLNEGKPFFIDFQGGRRGPVYYDIASFVYQVRAAYPDELRTELVQAYVSELERVSGIPVHARFHERLRLFRLFRLLQVMGAYGFRGLIEHKAKFVESIPGALDELRKLIAEPFPEYPYLQHLLSQLADMDRYSMASSGSSSDGTPLLEVKVYSFSYKKGIPEDYTGNGGGYVFDCRSIHNPGRYEQYRQLTGLDAPVREFLEDDGGVLEFLAYAETLVDSHVRTYIRRGFTSLSVSFGCTGGQHRSVYCAQSMAAHIASLFPQVRVRLIHRERGIEQIFGPQVEDIMPRTGSLEAGQNKQQSL